MAIERERKFLLKSALPEEVVGTGSCIEQGYLMFDDNKHLRVRIIDNRHAFITFKTIESASVRIEYEYAIPLEDAREMMKATKIKLSKTRYRTYYRKNEIDIDIFDNGTAVVEIEYKTSELLSSSIPSYCGKEVTGKKRYSNIWIAKHNK